jgi:hypothetical protein
VNRFRFAGLPWSVVLSVIGVVLAVALLALQCIPEQRRTLLWYALERTSFVEWGVGITTAVNTMQLLLVLLLAKSNPQWLPVALVGRAKVSRSLEHYGYEVTKHIPIGDVVVTEGEPYGDPPQHVPRININSG